MKRISDLQRSLAMAVKYNSIMSTTQNLVDIQNELEMIEFEMSMLHATGLSIKAQQARWKVLENSLNLRKPLLAQAEMACKVASESWYHRMIGTVWIAGHNEYGQLGLGTDRSPADELKVIHH